jgi:penicillin-binding protein A
MKPAAERKTPAKKQAPPLTIEDIVRIDENTITSRNLTIDWDLQQYIGALAIQYKLYYGSIAVMDARTGDILALYGHTRDGQDCSLSLNPELAASIFKMVTAVAAIEEAGFTGQSMFFYTGSPHTLYKRQLTNKRDRWCADVSLADAFARSNNIVFGKLGSIYLGETPIYLTTKKLGFWKSPLKEIKTLPSTSMFPKDEYNLAELACGFNKQTRVSPLHAAEMVTAVLNDGSMITPRLVKSSSVQRIPAMKAETAHDLREMMERTVRKGTVAKSFRNLSSDRVLKNIAIGGKSGSIDGKEPTGRRNWFMGFARNRVTGEAITIGCLLILDDRFWIEADMLSRLIIRHHFARPVNPAPAASYGQDLTASRLKDARRIP